MTARHFLALLRKDWRLNAVPIYGGALLVASPYVVVLLSWLSDSHRPHPGDIAYNFQVAASMGVVLSVAVSAVFGGVAFALERRERSADYLAMLPVARWQILMSKLVIGLAVPALFWLANFLGDFTAFTIVPENHRLYAHSDMYPSFAFAAAAMFFAFALAWYLSVFLRSPAVAASISIGVVLALAFWPFLLPRSYMSGLGNDLVLELVVLSFAVPAMLAIISGSLHYLRRVEP